MKKLTFFALCVALASTAVDAHQNHPFPPMEKNSPMAKISPERQQQLQKLMHETMAKLPAEERQKFRENLHKIMLKNDDNAPCQIKDDTANKTQSTK